MMQKRTTRIRAGSNITNLDLDNPQRISVSQNSEVIGEVWWLPRATWGAGGIGGRYNTKKHHGYPHALKNEGKGIKGAAIHHSEFPMQDYDGDGVVGGWGDIIQKMKVLQTAREADLGPEVPYSYVVFPHPQNSTIGILAEGRGNLHVGAHTKGKNSSRLGICFDGNYQTASPSEGQIFTVQVAIKEFIEQIKYAPIGHRDVKSTCCPGDHVYARMKDFEKSNILVDTKISLLPIDAGITAQTGQPAPASAPIT